MKKYLMFDMDGTIADLYGVEDWLPMLRAENPLPYVIAKPLYNMTWLASILRAFKNKGWKVAVVTWGSKFASPAYNAEVAEVKKQWLDEYDFPYDEFIFQPYGTPKNEGINLRHGRQVLIDDNEEVRNDWLGETIDATKDIINELQKLYAEEGR